MKLHNKNTGEDGRLMLCHDYDEYPLFVEIGCIKIYYRSFADMVEAGWEYIKITAESLIRDEKIREAVRAWLECCRTQVVNHYLCDGNSCFVFTDEEGNDCCLDFTFRIDNLESNTDYTIAELCGEDNA